VVLGRGGVDPSLWSQGPDPDRELLDEALTAIAVVATRLRAEQQRRGRLELEVERLEGSVGLLEERIDELVAAVHAALRGGA
jgi:phage shock protein A